MRYILIVVTLIASACGGATTPAAPTPPRAVADVYTTGQLSFPSCTAGNCSYQGQIINRGPDCAQNVRGVTHLFDAANAEIAATQWSVQNRMRPAEQVLYGGCCLSRSTVDTPGTYRTDVFFDSIACQ